MAKVDLNKVKKYAKACGYSTIPIIMVVFVYMALIGNIQITGYSKDSVCEGSQYNPCLAYVNFTVIKAFTVQTNDTSFFKADGIKEVKVYQWKSNKWSEINFTKGMTFSKGVNYSLMFKGYKNMPTDTIKWGFGNIDPYWNGTNICNASYKNFSVNINPCVQYDLFNKETEMNFTWNGTNTSLDFYFSFPQRLNVNNTRVSLYYPVQTNITYEVSSFIPNVINISVTSQNCSIGEGSIKRLVFYQLNNTVSDVYCFSRFTNVSNNYTVYWNSTDSSWTYWKDITNMFKYRGFKDVDGEYKYWYSVENVNFTKNQTYRIKFDYVLNKDIRQGKWGVFVKPNSMTLKQAISSDNYVYIDPWWDTNWIYKKKVDLLSISGENLTNYPYQLSINTSALITAGKLQADCDDLRFLDSVESTELDYELVGGCNTTTTQVWIKVPTLKSDNSTYVYMYYGNLGASAGSNPNAVWSDYVLVLHMDENASNSTAYDISPSGYNYQGTTNTNVLSATGKFGNGFNFANLYHLTGSYMPQVGECMKHNCTITFWLKSNVADWSTSGAQSFLDYWVDPTYNFWQVYYRSGPNDIVWQWGSGGAIPVLISTSAPPIDSIAWQMISSSWSVSGNQARYWFNQTNVENDTGTLAWTGTSFNRNTIAWATGFPNMNMIFDEVRIANFSESDDWVKMDWAQGNQMLYTFGAEQNYIPAPEGWWNDAWANRKEVDLNSVASSNLTDYPYYVKVDTGTLISEGKMISDCNDTRFVDNTGYEVPFEIESGCNTTNMTIWVLVPNLNSNNSTKVWMYYNNPSAADGQNPYDLWVNYEMVLHLSENDTNNVTYDSNVKSNNWYTCHHTTAINVGNCATSWIVGYSANTTDMSRVGKFGRGFYFEDGYPHAYMIKRYSTISDMATCMQDDCSIQYWYKGNKTSWAMGGLHEGYGEWFYYAEPASYGTYQCRFASDWRYFCGNNSIVHLYSSYSGGMCQTYTIGRQIISDGLISRYCTYEVPPVFTTNWWLSSSVYSVSNNLSTYYSNATNRTAVAGVKSWIANDTSVSAFIGASVDGIMDEIRIASFGTSPDWVKMDYGQGTLTLYTVGSEENNTNTIIINNTMPPDNAYWNYTDDTVMTQFNATLYPQGAVSIDDATLYLWFSNGTNFVDDTIVLGNDTAVSVNWNVTMDAGDAYKWKITACTNTSMCKTAGNYTFNLGWVIINNSEGMSWDFYPYKIPQYNISADNQTNETGVVNITNKNVNYNVTIIASQNSSNASILYHLSYNNNSGQGKIMNITNQTIISNVNTTERYLWAWVDVLDWTNPAIDVLIYWKR